MRITLSRASENNGTTKCHFLFECHWTNGNGISAGKMLTGDEHENCTARQKSAAKKKKKMKRNEC